MLELSSSQGFFHCSRSFFYTCTVNNEMEFEYWSGFQRWSMNIDHDFKDYVQASNKNTSL